MDFLESDLPSSLLPQSMDKNIFRELFNLEDIQKLQDSFAQVTGVAAIIVDLDGNGITRPSNFCDCCQNVLQETEEGRLACRLSHKKLGAHSEPGIYIQNCFRIGLLDASAVIEVDGYHVATWLIGQVIIDKDHEEKVYQNLLRMGIKEDAAQKAIRQIPHLTLDRFQQVCDFLYAMANQVSQLALKNYQLAMDVHRQKRVAAVLKEHEEQLQAILSAAPIGIATFYLDTRKIIFANASFASMIGYSSEEIQNLRLDDLSFSGDLNEDRTEIQQLIKNTATSLQREKKFRTRSEHSFWTNQTLSIIHNVNNEPLYGLMLVENIQDRKMVEKIQKALVKIAATVLYSENLEEFYSQIHQTIGELMIARNMYLALVDETFEWINFAYFVDELNDIPEKHILAFSELEKSLTAYVIRQKKSILLSRDGIWELAENGEVDASGIIPEFWLGVPLITPQRLIGVLAVQTYIPGTEYRVADKDILEFVSSQIALAVQKKQTEQALVYSTERFRNLYENSPIAIWEEDFSDIYYSLQKLYGELGKSEPSPDSPIAWAGYSDARKYFEDHPETVQELMRQVHVLDVNNSALKLYKARSKEELIQNIEKIFSTGRDFNQYIDEIVAIIEKRSEYEIEGVNCDLDGNPLNVQLRWSISPEFQDTYRQVLVSIVDLTGRKDAERGIHRQLERLAALRRIELEISSSGGLENTIGEIILQTQIHLACDAVNLLLLRRGSTYLQPFRGEGFRTRVFQYHQIPIAISLAGQAVVSRKLIEIPNTRDADLTERMHDMFLMEGFESYYAMPLEAKGEVNGVLEIFQRRPFAADQEWLNYFATLAGQAAIALDNAQLLEKLEETNQEIVNAYHMTLEALARALELRDYETVGHMRRVSELTLRLAAATGIPQDQQLHLWRGAILHDIGKMGIPDHILLKPGPLTDDEWILMRKHPIYAFNMLSSIRFLEPALDIPYFHHEKWDGSGYPFGLSGKDIPLSARIFAIVDVWDALCHARPYKRAWSEEEARQYLREQSGKHFDPKIVDIFLNLSIGTV